MIFLEIIAKTVRDLRVVDWSNNCSDDWAEVLEVGVAASVKVLERICHSMSFQSKLDSFLTVFHDFGFTCSILVAPVGSFP